MPTRQDLKDMKETFEQQLNMKADKKELEVLRQRFEEFRKSGPSGGWPRKEDSSEEGGLGESEDPDGDENESEDDDDDPRYIGY